jgi:hypothetical protein
VVGRIERRGFTRSKSRTSKEEENLMKKVTLFACLLVLALGASAQTALSVRPIAIPPNAHNGAKAEANGITVADHAVSGQSPNAVSKSSTSGGQQVPPIAKTPPNAVHVPPVAKK